MRVAFLGNDLWSVPSVEAVAASPHELALVVTRVPRPAGRGGASRPTAVADVARRLSLPLLETTTVKGDEGLAALREAAPDVLAVVAYGEILPDVVLSVPAVAPVNVHFSLLPRWRGADPVRRAILAGDTETGVTTMRMDVGLDTGPLLLQAREPIRDDDDAGTLGARLAARGGSLLVETLDGLAAGELAERAQPDDGVTIARKLRPEEEWVVWTNSAEEIVRLVRALAPEPGARTRFRGGVLKLLHASPGAGSGEPGAVIEASKERFVIAAGREAVLLDTVVPEGKRAMGGADFARGRRPELGERLE